MELPRPVPTDVALLRDAERDPEAFGELFRRHAPSVHAWLERRLQWAASDLTAETFARAWLSRRRFRGPPRRLAPSVAARHRQERPARLACGAIGSRPQRASGSACRWTSPPRTATRPSRSASRPRAALAAALGGLSAPERDAVELRVLDGLPYDEVAERLGIQPAAARLRVSRGLRHLAAADIPQEER